MACGSCGQRRKNAGDPPPASAGPGSKVVFYSVAADGSSTPHRTLVEARVAARSMGNGATVEGRRERIS